MNKHSFSANKNLFFYDVYERHRRVAQLINLGENVLDVGGQLNALSQFCPAEKITVANLESSQERSNVTIQDGKLPFKDESFDVVCAIDVLEHIEKKKRKSFVSEILRVATKRAILSFPIDTSKHLKYEAGLAKILKEKGIDVTYLQEHVKYKLPNVKEIKDICKGLSYEISYSGILPINSALFRLFLFDPQIKFIRKLVYFFKLFFNLASNNILYTILSQKPYTENVNRAYLVIKK